MHFVLELLALFTSGSSTYLSQSDLEESPQEHGMCDWFGYKFVGDNIDKSVKPSFQRAEHRGQSFYHFHGYAVRDRVNLSGLSDEPHKYTDRDPQLLLPSSENISTLKQVLRTLISR